MFGVTDPTFLSGVPSQASSYTGYKKRGRKVPFVFLTVG